MNQEKIVEVLVLLQLVSFMIVFLEREEIKRQLKTAPMKVQIGRAFMFGLPTLTLISILFQPL